MKTDLFGVPIIDSFRSEYHFLSNFYLAPVEVWSIVFPSTEHAYQWAKTLDPKEQHTVLWRLVENDGTVIEIQTTPGQAKRAGAKVTLREDWDDGRVMAEVLTAKFTQNVDLLGKLLDTGDALLIEGNTWHDNDWGACTCKDCKNKEKLNKLGKLLMHTRDKLKTIK